MKWIKGPPTQEGYYWMRSLNNPPEIVKVSLTEYRYIVQCGNDYEYYIKSFEPALWYGPLIAPEIVA